MTKYLKTLPVIGTAIALVVGVCWWFVEAGKDIKEAAAVKANEKKRKKIRERAKDAPELTDEDRKKRGWMR